MHYERSKVMLHTLCFVIGVSFAFFLLGLGFSTLGTFFKSNQLLFARVGGILVVLFGFLSAGIFLVRAEPWERSTGCLLSWICWPCRQ